MAIESSPVRQRGVAVAIIIQARETGDRKTAHQISVAIFDSSNLLFHIFPALTHGATFCRRFQRLKLKSYKTKSFRKECKNLVQIGGKKVHRVYR